jgi:hydrogenase maturation protein HypF
MPEQFQARKIILSGVVQGVGFRPFIYLHAQTHELDGWVRNVSGRVEAHVQGPGDRVEEFISTLLASAPPLSRPRIESVAKVETIPADAFAILESEASADADIHLPADLFTCDDCLRELNDPSDRRHGYPFINCTQCGPRYTLIEALPYDRPNTSMSGFPLCEDCNAEYTDPVNRRYHAEPVACERCGPVLSFVEAGQAGIVGNEPALGAALQALAEGKIVAIKGIGGYHLVCDARNDRAVTELRERKPRPHKPLAVMFPSSPGDELEFVDRYLAPTKVEAELLESPARPIVLMRKKAGTDLSEGVAPGLNEVGAMLPYSPLHHLLLNGFGAPVIATSANISGEPVLTDNRDVEQRLAHVTGTCLHHDRPIVRPADDPVFRVINEQHSPIRQGRGLSPVEIELPFMLKEPLLAVGAHMKNTIALAWDNRAVVSPHIGEMDSPRSLQTFEQCIADLQSLFQVEATHIASDAHPDYVPSRWARRQGLPVSEVYHHHAHASAAWFDARTQDEQLSTMLVFTWDGVGLGPDGTLWGGEALLGRPGQWRHAASFRPFRLPGGDKAGRQPWRSAAALCWEAGRDCPLEEASEPLLRSFWQQGKNAPLSTAVGRIFDAAAALTGVCTQASFEGQGPMQLEALAALEDADSLPAIELELTRANGVYRSDWQNLLPMLSDDSLTAGQRAACFHASIAHALLTQAERVRRDTGISQVGLSGGVFQNRVLTEKVMGLLNARGFTATLPGSVPVNDGGIAFGQIVEAAHQGTD